MYFSLEHYVPFLVQIEGFKKKQRFFHCFLLHVTITNQCQNAGQEIFVYKTFHILVLVPFIRTGKERKQIIFL